MLSLRLIFFCVLFMVGCKTKDLFVYDFWDNKLPLEEICSNSSNVVFFVVDFLTCHECFLKMSKFLVDSSAFFKNSKVVLLAVSNQSIAERKLYLRTFEKYCKEYAENTYFLRMDTKFFKYLFPDKFNSPSIVILKNNEKKLYIFAYKDLFASEDTNILPKAKDEIKNLLSD